ncbi:MAG: hypothetical protein IPK16_15880 [Anaerolineales bacterium]|nr:hypothetical protein [Anaerolineales bacterium]
MRADDGIRVWVDGRLIIDQWHDSSGSETHSAELYLDGHKPVVVEYYQHLGNAFVYFWWDRVHSPTSTPTRTPTPEVINPYADASPSTGSAGTRVTVNFGGFPPYALVNLHLGAFVRRQR